MIEEAKKRAEVFEKLECYLRKVYQAVKGLDEGAEIYLFGSAAEEKSLLSSDIDVLVVTNLSPEYVISKLWERGIKEPFEIHVVDRKRLEHYLRKVKMIRKLEYSDK